MPPTSKHRWSKRVAETSDALDIRPGIFLAHDPKEIARSLKRAAERSRRRKSDPFRSAMSMLNFLYQSGRAHAAAGAKQAPGSSEG